MTLLPTQELLLRYGYWTLAVAVVTVGVAFAGVTTRYPRRWLVVGSAVALVVAVTLTVLPHPPALPVMNVLLGLAVLALSALGGGPAVLYVLAIASGGVPQGAHGGIVVERAREAGAEPTGTEVLRGGTTIGMLERLAATGSILAGMPTAIAAIIAVKGVGRFTELDVPEARERFIIGTLVSLLWACGCGAVFHFAVQP